MSENRDSRLNDAGVHSLRMDGQGPSARMAGPPVRWPRLRAHGVLCCGACRRRRRRPGAAPAPGASGRKGFQILNAAAAQNGPGASGSRPIHVSCFGARTHGEKKFDALLAMDPVVILAIDVHINLNCKHSSCIFRNLQIDRIITELGR